MTLPTEPIGSIPRPRVLLDGMQAAAAGQISPDELDALFDDAVRDTLRRFEGTGSPVVTDGEQRKQSFATYAVAGLANLDPGGVTIPFKDGHTRQLPVLTAGPFRYATQAWSYLDGARGQTTAQLKQAVISASAMSLLYPQDGIAGYPREAFIDDLVAEADRERVLRVLGDHATGDRMIFVGVTDPIDPRAETAQEVRDRVLEAATFIDRNHLGTTDDCGFSPLGDDTSTSRDTAFAKIQARCHRNGDGRRSTRGLSRRDRHEPGQVSRRPASAAPRR